MTTSSLPNTPAATLPTGACLSVRLWNLSQSEAAPPSIWESTSQVATLTKDLIAASGTAPVAEQNGILLIPFPSFETATFTARRLQWAVQGYSETDEAKRSPLPSLALLIHGTEEVFGQQVKGNTPHPLQKAEPGTILLSKIAVQGFADLPGFRLQTYSIEGFTELVWWNTAGPSNSSQDEAVLEQLITRRITPPKQVKPESESAASNAAVAKKAAPAIVAAAASAAAAPAVGNSPSAKSGKGKTDKNSKIPAAAPQSTPAAVPSTPVPKIAPAPKKSTRKKTSAPLGWIAAGCTVGALILGAFAYLYHSQNKPVPTANAPEPVATNSTPVAATLPPPAATPAPVPAAPQPAPEPPKPVEPVTPPPDNHAKTKAQAKAAQAKIARAAAAQATTGSSASCNYSPSEYSGVLEKADKNLQRGKYKDAERQYGDVLGCDKRNARAHEGLQRTRRALDAER